MAFKYREEIVGKRFLSVRSALKLKLNKITEWEWRAGVVRASTHKDLQNPELSVSSPQSYFVISDFSNFRAKTRTLVYSPYAE
jgi:hypothetical protein